MSNLVLIRDEIGSHKILLDQKAKNSISPSKRNEILPQSSATCHVKHNTKYGKRTGHKTMSADEDTSSNKKASNH